MLHKELTVEEVQWEEGRDMEDRPNPPHFRRNVLAQPYNKVNEATDAVLDRDKPFVILRKRAATTPKELVDSKDFKILCTQFGFDDQEFAEFTQAMAVYDGGNMDEQFIDKGKFLAHFEKFNEMTHHWLGRRSVALFSRRQCESAKEESTNLKKSIRKLITQINHFAKKLDLEERIDVDYDSPLGAVTTIIGEMRNHLEDTHDVQAFKAKDGVDGVYYDERTNIETNTKRRSKDGKAKAVLENGLSSLIPKESEMLQDTIWIERRYEIGGIKVAVFFNSEFASHMIPGAEALFGKDQKKLSSDISPKIKLYFGVDEKHMNEENRMIFGRDKEINMMVKACDDMDYLGYVKKSLLTLNNIWLTLITAAMTTKYYFSLHKHGKISDEKHKQLLLELRDGFPSEFIPILEDLIEELKTKPEIFQQKMPKYEIPEIEYETEGGFDPGRYILFPVHGAAYTIKTSDGREFNLVLPGDSGVGKSEVLRELLKLGYKIINIQADDMGSLIYDRVTGKLFSEGTETGGFGKTDDLPMNGTVNTTDVHPLVGYNADEPGGNRRVIEPHISNPVKPKPVDGLFILVNAEEHDGRSSRVKEISMKELVETWCEGPYINSSSVEGGGNNNGDEEIVNVTLWNEFGPNFFEKLLKSLLKRMLLADPREFGSNEEQAQQIEKERASIFTLKAITRVGKKEDKDRVFPNTAVDAKEVLDGIRKVT